METIIALMGVISVCMISGHNSLIVKESDLEVDNNKRAILQEKRVVYHPQTHQPQMELIIDLKNFSKKHRRERIRKRKDKGGKTSRPKGKSQKLFLDYLLRNAEKVNLVRNRTIEILKNGIRILSTAENYTQTGNTSTSRVNETLLEKILSSPVSKQHVLSSGSYEVPVRSGIYPMNDFRLSNDTSGNKKHSKSSEDDYDYDSIVDFKPNSTNDLHKTFDYESMNLDHSVGTILEQIVNALKNLTNCPNGTCPEDPDQKVDRNFEDPCLKWLNCKESLDHAFLGENFNLPSCPCMYPSTIFYDDTIWDAKQKRYFRWRDASGEAERLDVYKPGAVYCIRSLVTQGSSSVSSQQCCYDRKLQLLTRGSGAGTINFISPDVSKRLHYTVDVLPWRLCKGDFTRYNMARNPNNGNDCPENPDDQHYQLQVKLSKIF